MYRVSPLFEAPPIYPHTAVVRSHVIEFLRTTSTYPSSVVGDFEMSVLRRIVTDCGTRLARDPRLDIRNLTAFLHELFRRGAAQADPLAGTRQDALTFARMTALCLHCRLMQAAWTAGPVAEGSAETDMEEAEAAYRGLLAGLRTACIDEQPGRLWQQGARAVRLVHEMYSPLLAQTEDPMMRVLAAEIGRRTAALAGVSLMLLQRMQSNRGSGTLSRVAQRRSRLFRLGLPALSAAPRTSGEGRPETVFGQVEKVDFERLDRISYGTLRLRGVEDPLTIWGRSLVMRGVGPDSWLLAVARRDDENRLVIEAEGPTSRARDVFEDWLMNEVRGAYDVHPGSIAAVWSFPGREAPWMENELWSRSNLTAWSDEREA